MNNQRFFVTHDERAALPRPKLARIRVTCQQKAKTKAETTAPI